MEGSYDSRPSLHPFHSEKEAHVVTQNVDYIKDNVFDQMHIFL